MVNDDSGSGGDKGTSMAMVVVVVRRKGTI